MKCLHHIHREEFISIQKKEIPLYAERGSLVVERKGLRNYLVCFWQGGKKKNHTYRECKTGTYSSYCEIAVRSGTLSRITMEWAWQPVWMQEKALLSLHGLISKFTQTQLRDSTLKMKTQWDHSSELCFLYLQHYLDYFIFGMIIPAISFC